MLRIFLLGAMFAAASSACLAQEWADLKGRFALEGKIPERKQVVVSEAERRANGLSADTKILDPSLIIEEKGKGIANILVWVIADPERPGAKMPIHASYEMPPAEHVIRIKNLAYSPHASIMRTGQRLTFLREDRTGHNVKIDGPEVLGQSLSVGVRSEWPMKKEFRLPAMISCSIHPHEKTWLLVRDNPYFAVTNEEGAFEIKNLPVGKWRFQFWHERSGYITEVTANKKKGVLKKGQVDLEIKKEGVNLGEVTLAAKLFDK
jgi:plastocyanin